MKRALICIFAALAGCTSHAGEDAKKCSVSVAQLKKGMEMVSKMQPYSGQQVGRCDLIVDDTRNVSVITPEIRRSVDSMIARKKLETKN